jgi:WD40 repeat protein
VIRVLEDYPTLNLNPDLPPIKYALFPDLRFWSLEFSPDGRLLAGIYRAGTQSVVRFWEIETGKILRELILPSVGQLAFNPDRKSLAVISYESHLYILGIQMP